MKIEFKLNGQTEIVDPSPGEILLDFLRGRGLHSVKDGCRAGHCGSCVVLVDGKAVNSCTKFLEQVHGKEITTLQGLDTELASLLKEAFLEVGAVQCGYCTPGMIISACSLLRSEPHPSKDKIKSSLDGNLCRCTGYVSQVEAILMASNRLGVEEKDE